MPIGGEVKTNVDVKINETTPNSSSALKITKSGFRKKSNNLKREIENLNVEYLYGGGYYILNSVKTIDGNYLDINILVETMDNLDRMKKLKIGDERSVK